MNTTTVCTSATTRTPDGYITVVRTIDQPSISTRQADANARQIGGRGTVLADKFEAPSMVLVADDGKVSATRIVARFNEPVSVRRYRSAI